MFTSKRSAPTAVIDDLVTHPHSFDFFQAVRWLERWYAKRDHLSSSDIMARRIAFRNSLSLSFPPSEIERLEAQVFDGNTTKPMDGGSLRQAQRVEITPAFMSLLGVQGTLPITYTETFLRQEAVTRDDSARAFLDIFLHRAVVLFYQGWRKHRLAIRYESDRRQQYLPMVLSLLGAGQKPLRNRLKASQGGLSDEIMAFFAGFLQQRTTSAHAMEQMLSLYFQVPIKVTPFVGRWFELPASQQSRLGQSNARLGVDTLAGNRVWQRDLRVGLHIGPLPLHLYQRFLPGGTAALALKEFTLLLTGVSLEYEVRLQLRASDVPPLRLGSGAGPRLGWETFITTLPNGPDRCDSGYVLHAAG